MKHILIAEDQQSARFVLTFQLKKAGFKVTAVENGAVALKVIKDNLSTDNQIDLLVTDIEMPEMSGLDLYKSISEQNINIPVIVMTAYGSKNVVVELMRMGCSEYLDKPFPPEELVDRIIQIFEEIDKRNEESQKIESNKAQLEEELNTYKLKSSKLREQVDSAKTAYESITKIEDKNLNVEVKYKLAPLADLGGDFFSIKDTETGCDILLADVAGHDMGSSFHTILIKSVFEENLKLKKNGADFFTELNNRIFDEGENDRMVTAIFIRIDIKKMTAEITSAGHPYALFNGNNSQNPKPIHVLGDILGILNDVSFETSTIDVCSGDRILFYSDGIEDSGYIDNKTGKKIKLNNLGIMELASKHQKLSLDKYVNNIWNDVLKFGKNNPKDDMSLVAIEIK